MKPRKPVAFPVPVVIDTREQLPYSFASLKCDARDGGGPLVIDTVRATLRTGDYTLAGYETKVAVERKSLADLYGTLARGRERFERELSRLAAMTFAAVVVEAEWSTIINEPPAHTGLAPKCVFRSILAWQQRLPNVVWWTVPGREFAEATTFRILQRFYLEDLRSPKEGSPDAPAKRSRRPAVRDPA